MSDSTREAGIEADSLISVFFSFLLLIGGEIAGIAIAGVLGVLICGALVWYIVRCCKKSKTSAETKVFLETQPA